VLVLAVANLGVVLGALPAAMPWMGGWAVGGWRLVPARLSAFSITSDGWMDGGSAIASLCPAALHYTALHTLVRGLMLPTLNPKNPVQGPLASLAA
jgi:hypothetical protein